MGEHLLIDPLLERYLSASEREARSELGRLLDEEVLPVVDGILGCRQGWDDDTKEDVLLRLIARLHGLRHGPGEQRSIADLRSYCAVVTYRTLTEHRRVVARDRQRAEQDLTGDLLVRLPDPRSNTAGDHERRIWLRDLWREIRQLPPRQRAALVLGLRDEQGGSAAVLLPLTGTASIRDIAEALQLPAERFARLWNRLPLDDAAIAELLGRSRQQVINLRKAARERLTRRMKRSG
jgi:DNA-directed RNA polymerase specialized sigma24 family protein